MQLVNWLSDLMFKGIGLGSDASLVDLAFRS
jgi:hypothetical protein